MTCPLASLSQPLPTSSTLGVLSGIGTTETVIQLTNGNPAVLSMPSSPDISGVFFRLAFGGIVHSGNPGSISCTLNLYQGSSATIGSDTFLYGLTLTPSSSDMSMASYARCFWNSTQQKLTGAYDSVINSSWSTGQSFGNPTVTSQSNLQFVLSVQFGTSNAANSFTLTEFKLDLV